MQVTVPEARNRLSQFVRSARAGVEVVSAADGAPVARLVPVADASANTIGTVRAPAILDWLARIHEAQILTYKRLSGLQTGLLPSFNEVLQKNGLRRYVSTASASFARSAVNSLPNLPHVSPSPED